MPYSLCTAFSESREYVQLQTQYHDGAIQRSQLAQTSRHTFALSQRLTAALVIALKAFGTASRAVPCRSSFYNLIEGSYDPDRQFHAGPVHRPLSGELVAEHRARSHRRSAACSWSKSHNPCPTSSAASPCPRLSAPGLTFPLVHRPGLRLHAGPSRRGPSLRRASTPSRSSDSSPGIGPRKFAFRRQHLNLRDRNSLVSFWEGMQGAWQSFLYNVPNPGPDFHFDHGDLGVRAALDPVSRERLPDRASTSSKSPARRHARYPVNAAPSVRFPSSAMLQRRCSPRFSRSFRSFTSGCASRRFRMSGSPTAA